MAALLALAVPALAADDGLHVESDKTVSLTWTVTDKPGYRWDIGPDGTVSDGTNDAYDGGMRLRVNGAGFASFGSAKIDAAGEEIEIGPWQQDTLSVWRRVRVNKEAGWCRWIDIFTNTGQGEVAVNVQYYFNMGDSTTATTTTSGKADLTEKDWGIVTAATTGPATRPAVVHMFATAASAFRPSFRFERGNDTIYYDAALKVPAGQSIALCFFEAQRRPYDDAVKFLKAFNPEREVRSLPAGLRRILINMTTASMAVAGVELTRNEKADLVVLASGDELLGTITNERFLIKALGGELAFPAAEVVGIVSAGREQVRMVLTTGEVISGRLEGGKVSIRLAGGTDLEVPVKGMTQAAYRVSPAKPEKMTSSLPMVVLRTGPVLAFEDERRTFRFQTPYGEVTASGSDLASIELDTPAGALHRMVFANGSVLAGLLAEETVSLKLRIGRPFEAPRQTIRQFVFPSETVNPARLATLKLRNADVLHGRVVDETWPVASKVGSVPVKCDTIAEAEFGPDGFGQVKLSLRDGTKLGGKLDGDYIRFRIDPGPEMKIFVGHIVSLTGGPAAGEPDKPAKAEDPPAPPPPPPVEPGATTRSILGRSMSGPR